MRKLLVFCAFVSLLLLAAPAMATIYTVDLGTCDTISVDGGAAMALPALGASISNWGEAESGGQSSPEHDGRRTDGNYGGVGNGNSRMVWGHPYSGDLNAYAYIVFPEDIVSVTIRHLNGSINDSFNLYVDNVFWGKYDGENGTEDWYTHTYSGTAGSVLRLDVTVDDPAWRELWGQLAVDWIEADTVPEPATLCLLGLGALSLIRKRR